MGTGVPRHASCPGPCRMWWPQWCSLLSCDEHGLWFGRDIKPKVCFSFSFTVPTSFISLASFIFIFMVILIFIIVFFLYTLNLNLNLYICAYLNLDLDSRLFLFLQPTRRTPQRSFLHAVSVPTSYILLVFLLCLRNCICFVIPYLNLCHLASFILNLVLVASPLPSYLHELSFPLDSVLPTPPSLLTRIRDLPSRKKVRREPHGYQKVTQVYTHKNTQTHIHNTQHTQYT